MNFLKYLVRLLTGIGFVFSQVCAMAIAGTSAIFGGWFAYSVTVETLGFLAVILGAFIFLCICYGWSMVFAIIHATLKVYSNRRN